MAKFVKSITVNKGLVQSATAEKVDITADTTGFPGDSAQFLNGNGTFSTPAGGGISDGDKGDITVSGATWTIDDDVVTNAKLANVATGTIKGRVTASTGDPEDLSVSQVKTLLDLTGTNTGDQTITLTGDVTGSGTGSFAATIANDAVTFAKMQELSANTLIGAVSAGNPTEITCTSAGRALLDDADNSAQRSTLGLGTMATQDASNAFVTFANTGVTIKDTDGSNTLNLVPGSNLSSNRVLTITTGDASRVLTLSGDATISGSSSGTNTGDQTITLTSDVTGSGTGSFATTIANNAVTYAKMQDVSAASRILGRGSASGSGDCEELTVGQGLQISTTVLQCLGASTSQAGVVIMASQSDMETATTTDRAVTPAVVKNHPGVCKGWVTFDGTGTPSAMGSYNYTSITDNGTGDYTIAWDVDFSAHTYVALCSATAPGHGVSARFPCLDNTSTGSTRIYYGEVDGSGVYQAVDREEICLAVFGDQ